MSNSKNIVTLYELNRLVSKVIESEMPSEYWVEAELSECRESRGHCYMELIQKDERTATPIAKASAKCWANKWLTIRPYFERTTGQQLHAGMKVLLQVYPQFHEAYGFSWIVTDIDRESGFPQLKADIDETMENGESIHALLRRVMLSYL